MLRERSRFPESEVCSIYEDAQNTTYPITQDIADVVLTPARLEHDSTRNTSSMYFS